MESDYMPVHDDLGKRMKEFYEQVPKTRLIRRTPVAIRIDGKAFHTFTRGFKKPFDEVLIKSMQETTKYLCENIQGCVLGYTQSDEITLILVDYKTLESSAWFDYEVQKMCSISASMATMAFNKFFSETVYEWVCKEEVSHSLYIHNNEIEILREAYKKAMNKGAMFDARVFNIPKEEVTNLIYWRQLDATRNSIQMVGQANFSHKELHGKSCNMIQDMLHEQKGLNWNDFPIHQKRGTCVIKDHTTITGADVDNDGNVNTKTIQRPHWVIDTEIPIFKGEAREYIDKLIRVGCTCQCKPAIAYIN
jgi:tRNA(His) 5'-end guanylyltransferase